MVLSILVAHLFKLETTCAAYHSPIFRTRHFATSQSIFSRKGNFKLAMSQTNNNESFIIAKEEAVEDVVEKVKPPMYLAEGIFSVRKPLEWTSNDVVSYIRGILEREAKGRGVKVIRSYKRRRYGKSKSFKVGHGGTLDPKATGVLVIGVGSGTRELQNYLKGSKKYIASLKFGEETDTLDSEGKVVKTAPFDHVNKEKVDSALPNFRGDIMQVPPIYSALKTGGKKLYELAREGQTAEDLGLEARLLSYTSLSCSKN